MRFFRATHLLALALLASVMPGGFARPVQRRCEHQRRFRSADAAGL